MESAECFLAASRPILTRRSCEYSTRPKGHKCNATATASGEPTKADSSRVELPWLIDVQRDRLLALIEDGVLVDHDVALVVDRQQAEGHRPNGLVVLGLCRPRSEESVLTDVDTVRALSHCEHWVASLHGLSASGSNRMSQCNSTFLIQGSIIFGTSTPGHNRHAPDKRKNIRTHAPLASCMPSQRSRVTLFANKCFLR